MNLSHAIHRGILSLLVGLAILTTSIAAIAARPFIDASTLDLVRYLPPPPADDSVQTRAELGELLAIQAMRTPQMVANANADVVQDVWRFTSALPAGLQSRFNAEALPLLGPLFERLRLTKSAVVDPAKKTWMRMRPYVLSSEVTPAVKLEPTTSWPSGHATVASLMAIVLAGMLPEYRTAIFQRATDYAENRVVGGVHYRSDIAAGRTAGALIALDLQRNPEFVAESRLAEDELRKVLGL